MVSYNGVVERFCRDVRPDYLGWRCVRPLAG
jgi:hypothetical protein